MKKVKESYTKNNIEQLFVPITIAKLAKKYGFDEDCFGYYEAQSKELIIYYANKSEQVKKDTRNIYDVSNINSKLPQWAISAPTYEQLTNWIRNKKYIKFWIEYNNFYYFPVVEHEIFDGEESASKNYYTTYNNTLKKIFKLLKK